MPIVSQQELIEKAQQGKVVSFPTDTVPALAALPNYADLIFATKKRSPDKPLILMGSSPQEMWKYVTGTPQKLNIWQAIAQQYWPGELTLVLPASSLVPKAMNPIDPTTIGMRIPNWPITQNILKETGCLATTSANLSGESALTKMSAIAKKFPSVYALNSEYEGNSGIASTVIKWTNSQWQILRQGQIKLTL